MIKIKHLLDAVEPDDGQRISVEPFNLTRDLREWCKVDHVLSHLGPPMNAWKVLEEHPDAYEYFRAQYHEQLKSNFADFTNSCGREGGAITAACFLSKFTEGLRWAHLDIAGVAYLSGAQKGSTGRPVALLVDFLANHRGS